jgi:hypothetical protein
VNPISAIEMPNFFMDATKSQYPKPDPEMTYEDQERLTDPHHLKRSLGRNYPGKSHDSRHSQIGFGGASP